MMTPLPFTKVKITDAYWFEKIALVRNVVLPYQWEILNDRVEGAEKSYCIRNFKAAAGDIKAAHGGTVFQDTDLYKWLEAVSYVLAIQNDSKLETLADEAVELIARAQQADGYLNTYYILMKPDKRYTNLMEGHELYCAGHMIEAAVAYAQATGKNRLLNIALKLARHLHTTFMPRNYYPGHPEIELALIKLYDFTDEQFCFDLAQHFINMRGTGENQLDLERNDPNHEWIWEDMKRFDDVYFQAHLPVREQESAEGHAVRAMYLYAAMADAARITGEQALRETCQKLLENVRNRKMYITGGIGSSSFGEGFTADWDLPNDTMYCETCASVGLMLFARRMAILTGDLSIYDVWERALSNTVMAGLGSDGKHFFYVNPLQVIPEISRKNMTLAHVKPSRQSWFGVACCPTNIARTLSSLSGSLYAMDDEALYVLAHIPSEFSINGLTVHLGREGEIYRLSVDGRVLSLWLRVPEGYTLSGEVGEATEDRFIINHPGGKAEYIYHLQPHVRLVYANPRAAANTGKACLMRGLDVYCLEEADNGPWLSALCLSEDAPLTQEASGDFDGLPVIRAEGLRITEDTWGGALYSETAPQYKPWTLTFVPYRNWGNRSEGEMLVWFNVK